MSEEIANQSEQSQEVERDSDTEALYESFGMPKQVEKKDVEFPRMDEVGTSEEDEEEAPTTEQETESEATKRTLKLKYNGEEKEVDEEEARTLAQKGMNYDKVQQKLTEQQKALDEVAQLQGFKDHADLIANLPKLREQQKQKEENAYNQLRAELREEAENAGLDPDRVEAWLDNHPLMKQAKELQADREVERQQREKEDKAREWNAKWNTLYQAFPDLAETAKAWEKGTDPDWYTPDMKARIEKGYDPIDAYKLAHSDKIQAQSKKAAEQKIIKQQQLGMRGHVNDQTAATPSETALLPAQVSLAEEFGVDLKGVQRQAQIIKNRR